MLRNVLIGLVLIAMILVSVALGADAGQKDALAAAENWLAMIDHGEYAKNWQEAAPYFKKVITEGEWVQSMQEVRNPLGKIISRKLKSQTPKTTLPNTPEGNYVVIQFETSFANGKSGIETVTPQLEKDGIWRVAGYQVQWSMGSTGDGARGFTEQDWINWSNQMQLDQLQRQQRIQNQLNQLRVAPAFVPPPPPR